MTGSRTWLNLALLVLAIALAVVAIYLPGLHTPAPSPSLTSLIPAQVTHIDIERSGQQNIRLVKGPQGWHMISPLRMAADEFRIQTLLRLTTARSQTHFTMQGEELAKFKLAAPRVRVHFNNTTLAFGGTEPLSERRYILVDQTIHLINDTSYYLLISAPTNWLSTALLPPASQVLELELPGVKAVRKKDGRWSLSPATPPISMDTVNALTAEWTHAQALQVKTYERAPAEGSVTIRLQAEQTPIRFDIVTREPELILARPELGIQYHLAAEFVDRLLKLP